VIAARQRLPLPVTSTTTKASSPSVSVGILLDTVIEKPLEAFAGIGLMALWHTRLSSLERGDA